MARRLLILLGALALAVALPAAAQAATFCVQAPGCTGLQRDTLQDALTAADTPEFPGTDRVELGAREYAGPFTADGDNPVEIVGVGQGRTVLTAAGDGVTVLSLAAASSVVDRVTVRLATGVGVLLTGGPTASRLENVTVELTGGPGTGVQLGPGPTSPAIATLLHVTLAGNGTGIGLDVTAGAASAASAASATLSSSVITRFAVPISAANGACPEPCTPAPATVMTDHSAYDATRVQATPPGTVTATNGPVGADPKLGADLRPAHDSPLIDTADPGAAAGSLDASGLTRVVDGDGNGSALSDIGALEYQRRAPEITAALAAPTSAAVGAAIGFSAAAIDPDGEAVGASWVFSDGATGSGFDVAHAFGAPGAASATVTVTDAAGVSATATVRVTISAAPPPAGAEPPATTPRRSVIARVLPAAVKLRAVPRRDRRKPYRFRLRGRVVLPEGISTAGCQGGSVQLAIRAGNRRMTRSAKLAADCSFRRTLKLGRKRTRRVVVRPRFGGTGALAPLGGRKLRLRAG